jgi:hypothetical protein
MTKFKTVIACAVVLGSMTISLVLQHQAKLTIQEENRQLRQQVQDLRTANDHLTNLLAQASAKLTSDPDHERELLKLRGEVGALRRQVAAASKAQSRPAAVSTAMSKETTPEEYAREVAIAKMNYAKGWLLAFFMYSEKNGGQFPTNFSQALSFWPSDLNLSTRDKGEVALQPDRTASGATQYGLVPDNYDIVYQGSMNTLTNPASIIVIREKEAWQTPNGGWVRAYAFADGHSEIHRAEDGNFLPWEQQHMVLAPGGAGQ